MQKDFSDNINEHLYRVLIDNSPEPVFILDIETGKFKDLNKPTETLFKLSKEELLTKGPLDLSPPMVYGNDASAHAQKYIQEGLQGGNPVFDWIHLDSEGVEIPCEIRLIRFPPFDKKLIRATVIDKTGQLKLEEAIEEREKRLQLAFKATGLGYFDSTPIENKLIWDDRMHELYGLPVTSTKDKNEYLFSVIHPEDKERILHDFVELMGSERKEVTFENEYRIIKNGEVCHIAINGILQRDPNGVVLRSIGTCQDITSRKLAEEKLLNSQQKLSEITERFEISTKASRVGIWEWNLETGESIWNETMCELYGLTYEEYSHQNESWNKRIHPDDQDRTAREAKMAIDGDGKFDSEFRVIWPDQSLHYIKSVATVQRNSEGKPIKMLGTNWDITKEKEAEGQKIRARQLELKNRELEQFAYVASHDLQEPLRTVIGMVGLLKLRSQQTLDDEANEHLNLIYQAATRMNQLIKALLDYSRIGHNKELTPIDCNGLVKHILVDLAAQISETKAEFEIDSLPRIHGFRPEIRVLLQNLISNALKFRKPNTQPIIRISAKKIKEYWEFCISDNGIGIEPEYQDKIFVIFQRLQSIEEYEGTGIGLAHCQKIADLHGGHIRVESIPQKGSSFYFTIRS